MTQRIANPHTFVPEAIKAMYALEASFKTSGLDPALLELVRLRASGSKSASTSTSTSMASFRNLSISTGASASSLAITALPM